MLVAQRSQAGLAVDSLAARSPRADSVAAGVAGSVVVVVVVAAAAQSVQWQSVQEQPVQEQPVQQRRAQRWFCCLVD